MIFFKCSFFFVIIIDVPSLPLCNLVNMRTCGSSSVCKSFANPNFQGHRRMSLSSRSLCRIPSKLAFTPASRKRSITPFLFCFSVINPNIYTRIVSFSVCKRVLFLFHKHSISLGELSFHYHMMTCMRVVSSRLACLCPLDFLWCLYM